MQRSKCHMRALFSKASGQPASAWCAGPLKAHRSGANDAEGHGRKMEDADSMSVAATSCRSSGLSSTASGMVSVCDSIYARGVTPDTEQVTCVAGPHPFSMPEETDDEAPPMRCCLFDSKERCAHPSPAEDDDEDKESVTSVRSAAGRNRRSIRDALLSRASAALSSKMVGRARCPVAAPARMPRSMV